MTKPAAKFSLVTSAPDIAQMEAVITEAAEQTMPVVWRSDSLRDELALKDRVLAREEADLKDRRAHAALAFTAADAGYAMQLTDIAKARGLLMHGLQP